jgi:hypothetical protein
MKLRLTALMMVLAILGAFVVAPLQASAAPPATSGLSAPATGTVTTVATGAIEDIASINVLRFVTQNGQLAAVVQLVDAAGDVLATITVPITATGTCEILILVLGPLHLELLGLVIDLNQVVLEITAEPGPGNLLGNLLCGIAGLLDSGVTTNALVRLLNQLLGLLG